MLSLNEIAGQPNFIQILHFLHLSEINALPSYLTFLRSAQGRLAIISDTSSLDVSSLTTFSNSWTSKESTVLIDSIPIDFPNATKFSCLVFSPLIV